MRTPLVVVTGIDALTMDSTLLSLSCDLPGAVAVRQQIDPEAQVLTRTVSDINGILDQQHTSLEHGCASCAQRDDLLNAVIGLAQERRWTAILAGLPLAVEAAPIAQVLGTDARLARQVLLSTVIAAIGDRDVERHWLGDDLLREHGLHRGPTDDRGVGEVACAQVEFADIAVFQVDPAPAAADLVRALARPGVPVIAGPTHLDSAAVVRTRHSHRARREWCSLELPAELPPIADGRAWRLELASPRPLHPERLLDRIDRLGTGAHRSRGSFWVPTRPSEVLGWSGAGGQLSIGGYSSWDRRTPATRLVFTGLGTPPELAPAFQELLLTPWEALLEARSWAVMEDGLEPWLGEIRDVA